MNWVCKIGETEKIMSPPQTPVLPAPHAMWGQFALCSLSYLQKLIIEWLTTKILTYESLTFYEFFLPLS